MKPVLNYNDKRVQKLWTSHACLGKRGKEFKFFHMDNFPENWDRVGVVDARQSGLTLSESIFKMNEELKNVRITSRRKPIQK